jgi:hypothetical protein
MLYTYKARIAHATQNTAPEWIEVACPHSTIAAGAAGWVGSNYPGYLILEWENQVGVPITALIPGATITAQPGLTVHGNRLVYRVHSGRTLVARGIDRDVMPIVAKWLKAEAFRMRDQAAFNKQYSFAS